jgi:Rieske Fe-S protein
MSNTANLTEGCAADCAIGRRAFVLQGAMVVAATALAACGATGDLTAPSIPSTGSAINIADYPSLATAGGVALVTIGNAPLAIVRVDASTFIALSRVCPHQGGIVNRAGSGFQCPIHGAQFTQTGQWVGGQRTSNLYSYTSTFNATANTLTIA